MKRDPAAAMLQRIGSYATELPTLVTWLRQMLFGAGTYQPSRHYMRGPGPKCREKQLTQYPGTLRDKWDS